MSTEKATDTAVQRALKRRKELQEQVKRSMSELEKIENFLNMYRHLTSESEDANKGDVLPPVLITTKAGYGKSQNIFEMLVRDVLLEAGHPMHSSEIIEAFRKRGHPIGGNETRTAWNRLWKAKDSGFLVNLPRHGYWLANEPLPDGALTKERPKRKHRPAGKSQRSEWQGKRIGRKRLLSTADVQRAEAMFLAGKSQVEVAAELGGIAPATLQNYFPGGLTALRKRVAETPAQMLNEMQARAEHERIRREIDKHRQRYFEKDTPTISDAEYDALRRRKHEIENRFPDLQSGHEKSS
jgi:hypothetical protein